MDDEVLKKYNELIGHATGKTITRRHAGQQKYPARNASQMIGDEMPKAMNEARSSCADSITPFRATFKFSDYGDRP